MVDAIRSGDASPIVVTGVAGSGKTRLLREVLDELGTFDDLQLLQVNADPDDADRPFAGLVGCLGVSPSDAATPSDVGSVGESPIASSRDVRELEVASVPSDRYRLMERYLDELSERTGRADVVVVVDDTQWLDEASLAVFGVAIDPKRGGSLRLVLAGRPVDDERSELQRMTTLAERAGNHLELGPISHSEVVELVGASLGARPGPAFSRLLRGAGGSPLHARELAAAAARSPLVVLDGDVVELPADFEFAADEPVSSVLLSRLHHVSEDAREAARVASVIGRTFTVDGIAATLGVPIGPLLSVCRELIDVGLVAPDGDGLTFCHDLAREAVYNELPDWARAALHRQLAAELVQADADPVSVAHHLGRADPGVDSGPWFERAGRRLLHTDPRAATALLSEAYRLVDRPSEDMLLAYVQSLAWTNDAEAAEQVARKHLRFGDAEASPLVHFALAQSLTPQGRLAEAGNEMERAGRLLLERGDVALGQQAIAEAGIHRALAFAHDAAVAGSDEVIADPAVDPIARVIALSARSWVRKTRGEITGAVDDARLAVELAGDDPHALRGNPHLFLADALLTGEHYDEFEPFAIEARRVAARHGSVWSLPGLSAMASGMHLRRGDWDKTIAECDAGLSWAIDTGNEMARPWLLSLQSVALLWSGRTAEAEASIADAESIVGGQTRTGAEAVVWARSWALELAGDTAAALPMLELLWQLVVGLDIGSRMSTVGPEVVRAATRLGRTDLAVEVTGRLEALDDEVRSNVPARLCCRGIVDGDVDLLERAAAEYHRIGLRVEQALALTDAAERAVAGEAVAGATTRAGSLLDRVDELHRELGADGLHRRLERLVGPLDVHIEAARRPARGAGDGSATGVLAALSPAERRVADLVSEGATNPEIAEKLFISRRTVESHLSHVYTKLGLRSRVELAVLVNAAD